MHLPFVRGEWGVVLLISGGVMSLMITVDVDEMFASGQMLNGRFLLLGILRVGSGCFTLQSIRAAGLPCLTRSLDHQDLG